jgi:hypothetical protein
MLTIPIKQGNTFLLEAAVVQQHRNTPVDITGWTITCHVKNGTTLIQNLTVTIVNALKGLYTLRCDDTTQWPTTALRADVLYETSSGQIISTETFTVDCKVSVTQ